MKRSLSISLAAVCLLSQTTTQSAVRVLETTDDGGEVYTNANGEKIVVMPDGSLVDYAEATGKEASEI
jgi:predicted porin